MPQQDDINIRVGVENEKEASQKIERLEQRIVTATERMMQLQVKAIRESLTGINRITFEQNHRLLQIEKDLREERDRWGD